MIALQALAILESAVLECKQRSIDTPEVMEALDLLAPHIKRQWVILQFRSHLQRDPKVEVDAEGQQLVLRATFPGIRDGVRELLGVRMDALARKFHETHDMAVRMKFPAWPGNMES
jgi:hypothetical protein